MRRYFLAVAGVFGFVSAGWAEPPARPIVLPDLPPGTTQNLPPGTTQNLPPVSIPPLGQAQQPSAPRPLLLSIPPQTANPGTKPVGPGQQGEQTGLPPKSDVVLPYPEKKAKLDRASLTVRKVPSGWQVWGGNVLVKNFGEDRLAAEDAAKAIRDLGPTEWATLGTSRPVVGYAITDEQTRLSTQPKQSATVDLLSVRAESLRGVWVVRDANSILLNFGLDKQDAEQAAAVARKYGFNRVGFVGTIGAEPTFSFFYATPEVPGKIHAANGAGQLVLAHQEQTLHRTGVPIPGSGFLGERVVVDAKKVDVRREGSEFVLVHGSDVIAKFGSNEWSARDAMRIVQEMKVTEFCQVSGQTFFLVNGKAPVRVPFSAQGWPFDPTALVVRPSDGHFGVFEKNGRQVFPAATKADGDALIRTVQAFGFDQTCQIGPTGPNSLKFLGRTRSLPTESVAK